ncbi:MAG: hypothetical protein M3O03_06690 [Pseudomonadota bacterium]|nr:hypothetical protein [Pseudomonadota bacterium]
MFDQDARFADIMIDSLDNKWGTAERFESRFHSQILAIIESGVSRGELPQQNTEELARNFHESFKFLTNPIFLRQLSSKDQKAKLDQTFSFLATNLK